MKRSISVSRAESRVSRVLSAATGVILSTLIVALGLVMTVAPASAAARAFASRFTTNVQGDIVFVSNTLMTCPLSVSTCAAAKAGNGGTANNNNSYTMVYVDIDADPTTVNSSSANLSLPSGASVLFARLYWGGTSSNAARSQAKFKVPGATSYANVTATQLDDNGGAEYQGSIDVTSAVQASGSGTYTVGNVLSSQSAGTYAGWSMVVAYSDPNGVMRNLTVFDGFQSVSGGPVTIPVSGFLTPPVGPVNTKLGIVAYEGDLGTNGDVLTLNGTAIGDAQNPTNNFFNSSITNSGAIIGSRSPNDVNTLGFDADIVQVANPGNAVLANGATSATIQLSTGGDVYYPGVVTFVTDLYAPKMKVDKTYTDLNGGLPRPGDVLEYTLTVSNSGKDPAIKTVLNDAIPSNTSYVPGSLVVSSGANSGAKSDTAGNDQGEFTGTGVRFFLGAGASGTVGGQMNENDITVVKFKVAISTAAPDGVAIPNTAQLTFTAQTLGTSSITPSVVVPVVTSNRADLAITKSDGVTSQVPGTAVQYTVVVSNTSASTNAIDNAIVADTLPSILSGATWTCVASTGSNCDAASGSGSIDTTVDLAVNGTATFTLKANVAANASGSLTNKATVTAPAGVTDADPSNNAATDTDTLTPQGDLSVTKTDGATMSTAVPGSSVTYTVVASNSGPSTAIGVAVNDAPPAASGTISWSCAATTGSTCPASGTGNLGANVDLASGGKATFTITYTVAPSATGSLANTASIVVPAGFTDLTASNNDATDTDTLVPAADLSVTKTHAPAVIVPGTNTTYTITVANVGPSVATTATLTDDLPSGFTVGSVASGVWSCGAPTTQIVCTATNLALGTSTVTVVGAFDPSATGTVSNKATVTSPSDLSTTNNGVVDAAVVSPKADLSITKSHRPVSVVAGATVTYALDVTNRGPSTAKDARVTDSLPVGLTLTSATGPGWTCTNSGQDVSCVNPALLPGSTSTILVDARLEAGATGTLDNTAIVSALTSDPIATNNSSTDSTSIVVQADLQVSKVHVGSFNAGNTISWIIYATNRGPSNVPGTAISDVPPAVVTSLTWTCSGSGGAVCPPSGVGAPNAVPVDLPSGATITMVLSGKLDPAATGNIVNTATLTTPAGVVDPNPTNNTGSDSTLAALRADLSVTKTNNQASVVPGSSTTYTVVISNAGPSNVTAATVVDPFPAELTNTSWSCAPSGGAACGGVSGIASLNQTVNLPVGSRVTYTISGTVQTTARGQLTNSAKVVLPPTETDPDLSNNAATDADPLTPIVDLNVTKTAAATAVAGTSMKYTIVVANNGPSSAGEVLLTDTMPAGLTATGWACTSNGAAACASASGVGTNDLRVKLDAGGSATFVVDVDINQGTVGQVTNRVSVAPTDPSILEPNQADNDASATTDIVRQVDLVVTKDDGVDKLVAGDSTTYRIHVENRGPSAVGDVHLIDVLPPEAIDATWTCTGVTASCYQPSGTDNAGVIDELAKFEAGGTLDLQVVMRTRPDARGQLVNAVNVEAPADVSEINPKDNFADDTDALVAQADLKITKTSAQDPGPVSSGQKITYTVRVQNTGPSATIGAAIADATPAGLTNPTWVCVPTAGSSALTTCPSGADGPLATLVNIAPNEGVEFTVTATVAASARGSIVNTASAELPADVDPIAGTRIVEASDSLAIDPTADLSISKDDGVTSAVPGESVTYTIVVRNAGPADVKNAVVKDNPTSAFPNGDWSCAVSAGGACAAGGGNGLINTTVSLPAGASATFVFSGLVNPFAGSSGAATMTNTASVTAPADTRDITPLNDQASDTDDLVPTANLSVTKTDNLTDAIPGSTVSYSIVVSNAGPSAVVGATLTDVLPAALSNASWTCAVVGSFNDCSVGSGTTSPISTVLKLAPNTSASFTVSARIDPAARGQLSNTASVSVPSGTTDPDPSLNSATDTDNLTPRVDLRTTKTHVGTLVSGTTGTWTITVSNSGPSSAVGAVVTDTLPATLSAATWKCVATAGSSCGSASGAGSIATTADLAPAGTATYTLSALIDPSAVGDLTNSASAAAATGTTDTQPGNNGAVDTAAVQPIADLKITKVRTGPIVPGQPISYKITVANDGPSSVTDARVLDPMPTQLVNPTWSCAVSGVGASCRTGNGTGNIDALVSLAPTTSAVFTVLADVPQTTTGDIVNTAQVLAPTGVTDPDALSNQASDTGKAQPRADLRISKTDNSTDAIPGDTTSYTIVVTNDGPSAVPGATVTDLLPSTLINPRWRCIATPGSSCGSASGTGNISSQVSLVSGAQATFVVTATIDQAARGTLSNTATVKAPATVLDPTSSNDSSTDDTALVPQADLRVVKRHVGAFVPGKSGQWTIDVTNLGPSSVSGATVSDTLPAGVSGATWTCDVPASALNLCADPTGSGDIATTINLAVGSTATFTVDATIDATARGNLSNTATAKTPAGVADSSPTNDSSTDTAALSPQADLSIVKTHVGALVPGTTATYNIVVTNAGPSTVTGARVIDALPSALSGATWTCSALSGSCPTSGAGNIDLLANLAVNGTATITVTATIATDARGSLDNSAVVSAPAGTQDLHQTDNRSTDSGLLTPKANLSLVKSHTGAIVPGQPVTYTITVGNSGPSNAIAATVTDASPSALSSATWTCIAQAGSNCASGGTGDIATTVDVAVGSSVSFSLTALVDPRNTAVVANTATVTPPADTTDPTLTNNQQTDSSAVVRTVDLTVKKSHSGPFVPGQLATWQISVANQGPSAVSGATVTDALPAGLTGASWRCTTPGAAGNACGASSGSGGISTTVDLLPGSTALFELTATIDPSTTGSLTNSVEARVPAGVTEPAGGDNTATDAAPRTPVADLVITKTHVGPIVPGQPVTYTIRVWNNGPSSSPGSRVTDALSSDLTNAKWTCVGLSGGVCTDASGVGDIATAVDLAPNSGATFTVTADVNASVGVGGVINTARVSAPTGVSDPDALSNTVTDPGTTQPTVDLKVTKIHVGAEVPGEAVTYTVSVLNDGPSAVTNAHVTDAVPAGLSAASWKCAAPTGSTCTDVSGTGAVDTFVSLLPHATATLTFTGVIDPTFRGTLTNRASATTPLGTVETNPDDNAAADGGVLVPKADLQVSKRSVGEFVPGTTGIYEITVKNVGPSTVTAANIIDTIPSGMSGTTWTCAVTPDVSTSAGQPFTNGCLMPKGSGDVNDSIDLGVGAVATVIVTGTIDPSYRAVATGGKMLNTATAIPPSGTTDPSPLNNVGLDRTALSPKVGVSIAKSHVGALVPGAVATYNVVVTNAGPSTAIGTSIADTLPETMSGAVWLCTATGGTCGEANGSGDLATTTTLLPGGVATYVISARINSAARGSLTNTATDSPVAGEFDTTTDDDSSTDTGVLTPVANLSISKSHTEAIVPGTRATWAIVVTNSGPSDVVDAVVTDLLASTLTAGKWTCFVRSGVANRCGSSAGTGDVSTTVSLATGESATFEVSALVDPGVNGDVVNTATVAVPAGTTDPDGALSSATDTGVAVPTADLSIVKTHTGAVIPGAPLTYNIVVTNNGPSTITGAVVRDQLPASLTNPRWTCSATAASACGSSKVTGPVDTTLNLVSGGVATIVLVVDVDAAITSGVINRASVAAPAGVFDPQSANDVARDDGTVTPTADLVITKVHVGAIEPSLPAKYKITVTNNGPSYVRGASVVDLLPPELMTPTWTCTSTPGASCPASGIGAPSLLADLAVGSSITIDLNVSVIATAQGDLINEARVTPPSGITDPNRASNSATDRAFVVPVPVVIFPPQTPTTAVTTTPSAAAAGPSSTSSSPTTSPTTPSTSSPLKLPASTTPAVAPTAVKRVPGVAPASQDGPLALTGSDIAGLVVVGSGSILIGSVIVRGSRRRRRR